MSDSLPENTFSGVLKVLKLTNGEEIIALVMEATPEFITLKYPALLENYTGRDEKGNAVEYVKLLNYLSNIKACEIILCKKTIMYIGEPRPELENMYKVYYAAMQKDPNSIVTNSSDEYASTENGLQLLNDLFNNEDFVSFVNELIETYEGVEILEDFDDGIEAESIIEPSEEKPSQPPPKKKKRKGIKPETKKLPYNPEADPKTPESWSDNPSDYL
jgi:hypothetical protein